MRVAHGLCGARLLKCHLADLDNRTHVRTVAEMVPLAANCGRVAVLSFGEEGGLVDWMGECVGGRIVRAIADAGLGRGELARLIGISERVLADRLAAPGSFHVVELVLLAAALGRDVQALLPDPRCSLNASCELCHPEKQGSARYLGG